MGTNWESHVPSDLSALQLVLTADPALVAIVRLSLAVSLSAVFVAALFGVPFGALVALTRFSGREAVIVVSATPARLLRPEDRSSL